MRGDGRFSQRWSHMVNYNSLSISSNNMVWISFRYNYIVYVPESTNIYKLTVNRRNRRSEPPRNPSRSATDNAPLKKQSSRETHNGN